MNLVQVEVTPLEKGLVLRNLPMLQIVAVGDQFALFVQRGFGVLVIGYVVKNFVLAVGIFSAG